MALLYLDTSALVKLYVQEIGTDEMLALAHPDIGNRLAILALTRIEFRAAVRRRAKLGDIDAQLVKVLTDNLSQHIANVFQIQPVNEAVLEEATGLIDRHSLRAYDAVQLGGCLALRATVAAQFDLSFVCADEELLEAARSEELNTINPMESRV